MVCQAGNVRLTKTLELDEALVALFTGAMNANVVADLLPADGKIDARERKFLERLAVNFNIRTRVASHVMMLVKNHL